MNQGKENLLLGCGKKFDSQFLTDEHNAIHPESTWITVDINPDYNPDVCADVQSRTLAAKIKKESNPPDGFKIIYAESLPFWVGGNPDYINNISTLLGEKGIYISDSLSPQDYDLYKSGLEGLVIPFANCTVYAKTPLSFNQIEEVLRGVVGRCPQPIEFFSSSVEAMQLYANALGRVTTFEEQQLIACYVQMTSYLAMQEQPTQLDGDLAELASRLHSILTNNKTGEMQSILSDVLARDTLRSLAGMLASMQSAPEELFDQYCENTGVRAFCNFLGVMRMNYDWVREYQQKATIEIQSAPQKQENNTSTNLAKHGLFAAVAAGGLITAGVALYNRMTR